MKYLFNLTILLSSLGIAQEPWQWESTISEKSCYASSSVSVGDERTERPEGRAFIRAAIPHSNYAEYFEELFLTQGENFLIAVQYYTDFLGTEAEATDIKVIVFENSYTLKMTYVEGFQDFIISGDKARQLWQKILNEPASIEIQLSNQNVYQIELSTTHLENVARMLEVCPS